MKSKKSAIEQRLTKKPTVSFLPRSEKELKDFTIDMDFMVKNCHQLIVIGSIPDHENKKTKTAYTQVGLSKEERISILENIIEVIKKE